MWLWCHNSVCIWCGYAISQCCMHLLWLVGHSAVCIWWGWCRSAVCIWCSYYMTLMYSMWLYDVTVLYVFDVVILSQWYCMYLMWLWDVTVLLVFDVVMRWHSAVCICCRDDVVVLYVFDVVIMSQHFMHLMWLWCCNTVCISCGYTISHCCMLFMLLWCCNTVCIWYG